MVVEIKNDALQERDEEAVDQTFDGGFDRFRIRLGDKTRGQGFAVEWFEEVSRNALEVRQIRLWPLTSLCFAGCRFSFPARVNPDHSAVSAKARSDRGETVIGRGVRLGRVVQHHNEDRDVAVEVFSKPNRRESVWIVHVAEGQDWVGMRRAHDAQADERMLDELVLGDGHGADEAILIALEPGDGRWS